ncbi:MAG: SIMPL domain-containing protein [Spirulinaceae cyanobacterium]
MINNICLTTVSKTLALAISFFSLIGINPVMAQEIMRTLTVTGQGEVEIPTTITQVRLGVEVKGKTATQVQKEVAERTTAVVNLLESRGVEKLETTGVSLRPEYSYNNEQRNLTGYIGTNIVSFRLPTEQTGDLIDATVNVGATRIDGINFIASDSAISAAKQDALREATEDAQKQADTVLAVLNLTRQDIVNIVLDGAVISPPQPIQLTNANQFETRSSSPIIGGEQKVQANVTLQITY